MSLYRLYSGTILLMFPSVEASILKSADISPCNGLV